MDQAAKAAAASDRVLRGIGVSPGVAIGPAHVVVDLGVHVPEQSIAEHETAREIVRFEDALIRTRQQVRDIQVNLGSRGGADAGILDVHLMVLDDRTLIEDVVAQIESERRNAESAIRSVVERHAAVIAGVEDEYLRERVADIRDVGRRLLRNLCGFPAACEDRPSEKHIIVARELAPSETAALNRDLVVGLAVDLGSATCHTAVMARAMGIPAVVGLHNLCERVSANDELLIDGNKGVVILRPTAGELREYGRLARARRCIERELSALREKPAETRDGHRVLLSANIEGLGAVDAVGASGAHGVGLFRTEYVYLLQGGKLTEEEQTRVYTEAAARLAPAPLVIRTLDVGGDKWLVPESQSSEPNPFLGCRSIRLSLLHPEFFRQQLRAILRASRHGNVKVMYPMICRLDEVLQANELLAQAKDELRREGSAFDQNIEVGIMVEIPSAALEADRMAEHVRFFSIGTNDLIQYTLAVDRGNERVAHLYEPTHPAVLRLIRETVAAGHRRGLWVGLCGEMAAAPALTPLLVGMGLNDLSMAPTAVPLVKHVVRSLDFGKAKALADEVASRCSAEEILEASRRMLREAAPEVLELV